MSKGIIKSWQSSTMPRSRKVSLIKVSLISEEQRMIFSQIVSILQPYSNRLTIRADTHEQYELWTKHSFRSLSMNPKNKRGLLFAGVLIMKKHVGLYFYPLHIHPDLMTAIDEAIRPFWKGNSAFHFRKPLSDLVMVKLTGLLDAGWEYYRQKQWIF